MKTCPRLISAIAALLVSAPQLSAATEPRAADGADEAPAGDAAPTSSSPVEPSTPSVDQEPLAVPRGVALRQSGTDDPALLELTRPLESTDREHPVPAAARSALWTSLAATGVLTGATVTFGLLTRRANAALSDRLARIPAPRAYVDDGRARVRNFALLTDGFGLAAATALGVSTYFYFSTGKLSDDDGSTTGLRAQLGPRASSLTWVADF
jgi:hypothetical protein